MLKYDPLACFPSSDELPDSDDTPVDNQLQHLMPNLLEAILAMAWADRMNWFFGVDMGVYYDPNLPPIVPDGFLSLGVERFFDENLRLSYAIWEEEQVPIFVLEVVSQSYRGEYTTKKDEYAKLGVLYYVVYNPNCRRKPRFEVYKLVNGEYQLQDSNPVWLPEVNLGIGTETGTYQSITREWLYWYDEQGRRLLTPEEQAKQAQQRADILAERLRALGVDPDSIA
ncbi:Uma2 family endonuclease [Scytonema hofmannii FACHB-248]|uniref:Uma2 family endonuclease n=1 Tax=Scytonema hofmannii FACHB-248 TaxID=1842502 RepID=A0ABR8GY18_9CYAN|nr:MULTISPECIES: Uma2 family endonuclease [Nostocales]MBD2608020.1 Uma2 family endonuclease [Scytonema hofmannii FACHB-248]